MLVRGFDPEVTSVRTRCLRLLVGSEVTSESESMCRMICLTVLGSVTHLCKLLDSMD